MPISKETIKHRKINYLCPRCGQPNANGKSLCQKHLDQFAAKTLKYRHKRIEKGLCPGCGGPNEENQHYCNICKEKYIPIRIKSYKKRYKNAKENSICFNCGKITINNKTRCEDCSLKHNENRKQEYNKSLENNLCVICRKNQVNEGRRCKECIEKRNKWFQKSDTKQKYKTRRDENKKMVIEHYGSKCVCCGENNISFLSMDHINNDGREHRKQVGEGANFYKWILDNNFPQDILQVLCFNCNFSKYLNNGTCVHQQKLTEDVGIISVGVPTPEKK